MIENGQALLFYQQYIELHEKDKVNFSRIVNKVLFVNYLTNQKESDVNDYYFISSHYDLFRTYFLLMDCELLFNANHRVIALFHRQGSNRLSLRLNESIFLLIIRLLYDDKMREVSLSNNVIIQLEEIHDKFLQTGLQDRRISKTELKYILSKFRRFNLIEVLDSNYNCDQSRILIYPTILYAVHIDDINQVYDKLSTYKKEGYHHEEINSDKTH